MSDLDHLDRALLQAIICDDLEECKKLLDIGANIRVEDSRGYSNNPKIRELYFSLKDKFPKPKPYVDEQKDLNMRLLYSASRRYICECIQFLELGADIKATDSLGYGICDYSYDYRIRELVSKFETGSRRLDLITLFVSDDNSGRAP